MALGTALASTVREIEYPMANISIFISVSIRLYTHTHTSNFTSPLTRAKIQVHTHQNHQCTFIPKIAPRSSHMSSWKPCLCDLTYSPQSPCGPRRLLTSFPFQRWGSRDSKIIRGSLSEVRTCEWQNYDQQSGLLVCLFPCSPGDSHILTSLYQETSGLACTSRQRTPPNRVPAGSNPLEHELQPRPDLCSSRTVTAPSSISLCSDTHTAHSYGPKPTSSSFILSFPK